MKTRFLRIPLFLVLSLFFGLVWGIGLLILVRQSDMARGCDGFRKIESGLESGEITLGYGSERIRSKPSYQMVSPCAGGDVIISGWNCDDVVIELYESSGRVFAAVRTAHYRGTGPRWYFLDESEFMRYVECTGPVSE